MELNGRYGIRLIDVQELDCRKAAPSMKYASIAFPVQVPGPGSPIARLSVASI